MTLNELRERKKALGDAYGVARTTEKTLNAKEDLSAEDKEALSSATATLNDLGVEITANAREILNAQTEQQREAAEALLELGGHAGAAPAIGPTPGGFATFGEQLMAVFQAAQTPSAPDQRLFAAATGLQEAVGADGGFLVQMEFAAELIRMVHETGLLASRVRVIPAGVNANAITLPSVDETSRADGSRWGGVQAFWDGEAEQFTNKKPKFSKVELKLSKLTGLATATDEMLQDVTALGAIIQDAFREEFGFKMDDAIFRGTGAGMPLGFFNSAAKVVVAKESGQVAATINEKNILKMWARMPASLRLGAVWLINVDAEPQLPQMVIGNQPIYLPPGGLSGQGFGSLMGRPVLPIEQADTVGQEGDFSLVNLNEYLLYEKGAMESATSIHVRFEFGEQVFRFVMRVDGKPRWKSALTPFKGTSTQSPFITLALRA